MLENFTKKLINHQKHWLQKENGKRSLVHQRLPSIKRGRNKAGVANWKIHFNAIEVRKGWKGV